MGFKRISCDFIIEEIEDRLQKREKIGGSKRE